MDKKIYYSGAAFIKASLVNPNASFELLNPAVCQDYVISVLIPLVCERLDVNHNEPIYKGKISTFQARALDNEFNNYDDKIMYWVEPGYGMFLTKDPGAMHETPAAYVPEITVIILNLLLINEFQFIDETTSLYTANAFGDLGLGLEDLVTDTVQPEVAKMVDLFTPAYVGQFLIADPYEVVYFLPFKPGVGKIKVKALNTPEGVCERIFDILDYDECKILQVNHPQEIKENTITRFTAQSLNALLPTNYFNGKITYTVEPG